MSSVLPRKWPDSWEARPAWDVLVSREEFGGEDDQLSLSVAHGIRLRDASEGRAASDNTDHYRVVRRGDLVINRLVARDGALHVSPLDGLISPAYWVMKTRRASDDARFIAYQLRSAAYLTEIARLSKDMPPAQFDLPWDQFRKMPIVLPAVDEQRAIADFLDTETARIDALIARKQQLLEVLVERTGTAFDAATQSVDRRAPLKRITDFREGPGVLAEDFRDQGVPLLRIAGLRDGYMTAEGCNFLDPATVQQRWAHLRVRAGDLVISASASMGVAGFVTEDADGAVPYTGLIRFRAASDEVDLGFVRYFLESRDFMNQIDVMKTGAAIQHFGPTHLAQVSVPLPGLDAQRRVARQLKQLHDKVRRLERRLDMQMERLRERRQALITAAVTGELDVPGVAA